MKRLLLIGATAVALMLPTFTKVQAATAPVFSDVPNTHWAAKTIYDFVNEGYMKGYEDGTFKPSQPTTRGEAAVIMARTMDIQLTSANEPKFQDVPKNHPYYEAIATLTEMGVLADGKYFYPNAPLKRSEISKMIALAYEVEVDHRNRARFHDLANGFWAKNYIESLADVDIVKGVTATKFGPNDYVTRAQIALLTKRGMAFKKQVANLELVYDFLQKDYISTVNTYEHVEKEIVKLVNEIRVEKNLQSLELDAKLTQIALIKAKDMVKRNYFEHYSPFYGNPWDLATLFDYNYTSFAENIARNFKTADEVVKAWMASPKHRANIVNSKYLYTGIGVEKASNGKFYIVQHFALK